MVVTGIRVRPFAFGAIAVVAQYFCLAVGHAQYAEELPVPGAYADRIIVRLNVGYGAMPQQRLDAYLPTLAFRTPVVICWFGGAFRGGDPSLFAQLAACLANQGIAAITPDYFLGARDGSRRAWPQAVYDAKSAVRYVRAHATELNIDPDRICALGYSSGAYLADDGWVHPKST